MPDPWLYLHGLYADREALEKKIKEEQSVRQRAKRLLLTGLMVCAMAASLVPAQAATIKEASVTWKEVSQDINDKDQYVYDTDKTDATMPSLVLSKSSIGVLGYIDRGIVQKNTGSLLVPNWEGWWHMKGGWKQDTDGLIQLDDGGWYQFSNGRLQVSENETAKNSSKGWLFLRDGKADLSYSGLVANENGIFWADNGVITTTKAEVVKDTIGITPDAGWIYVRNGVFDASANTVANNKNGWWMIRDGVVDFNYTGLAKNAAGWWYLQDGKVNFNYNGAVQNENGIWYVQGGNVKFDYNGHAYGYYFSGGCAQ